MIPDTEKKRACCHAVVQHLEERPFQPEEGKGKNTQCGKTHVGNARIGNELLHVGLAQADKTAVDNANNGEGYHLRGSHDGSFRRNGQAEPQKPVCSHLQEDAGEENATSCRRFRMGRRQPCMEWKHGYFDREGDGKSEKDPELKGEAIVS